MLNQSKEPVQPHTWENRVVKDYEASKKAGYTVHKNQIWLVIQILGSRDTVEHNWEKVRNRKPEYEESFQRFQSGQEMIIDGTDLRLAPFMDEASIRNCHQNNVRSVEQLADAPENLIAKLGFGARKMVNNAKSFLDARTDGSKIAQENAELKQQLENQQSTIDDLGAKIGQLQAALLKQQTAFAEDYDEGKTPKPKDQSKRRGRPPKNESA